MALTKISTDGVKDNAIETTKIADSHVRQMDLDGECVNESKIQISNAGTNGQFLQKQSGNNGGLTWSDVPAQYTHPNHSGEVTSTGDGATVIADNIVDEANLKVSNTPTNGQFLSAQSGASGGLTWADVSIPPSGNTFTAVANGNIANNKAVKIDTDGKVSEIGVTVTEVTSITMYSGGTGSGSNFVGRVSKKSGAAFSVTSGLGYVFYKDTDNSPYPLKVKAVRFDGGDGTFAIKDNASTGSIVALTNYRVEQPDAAWDATNNKVLVVYKRDSDDELMTNWINVNQTASDFLTAGTEFNPFGYTMNYPKVIYGGSGRFVIGWNSAGSVGSYGVTTRACVWNGSAYVMSGSHASPYSGSANSNSNRKDHLDMAYHTANSKIIAVWKDVPAGNYGKINVGTFTGSGTSTSITWGTESTFAAGSIEHPQVIVDDNTGKIVVCYYNNSSNTWNSKVGVLSGNSVTFGSAVTISSVGGSNGASDGYGWKLLYVPGIQKVQFYWNGDNGGYKGHTATGTVSSSSSTITWANAGIYMSNGYNYGVAAFAPTPDNVRNRIFIMGRDESYATYGRRKLQVLTNEVSNLTNAKHYVGFADQAYTNGQTATISTYGNNVNTLSGMTATSQYYVQGDGTLATNWDETRLASLATNTPLAGTALSATKLLIRDPLANT